MKEQAQGTERRRKDRMPVDLPGTLYMTGGRNISARLVNVGGNGVLVRLQDFEHAVEENERVLVEHPGYRGDMPHPDEPSAKTPGVVVRVEVDFSESGITRHVAIHFDGGPAPELD